jgi:hypothetical protein
MELRAVPRAGNWRTPAEGKAVVARVIEAESVREVLELARKTWDPDLAPEFTYLQFMQAPEGITREMVNLLPSNWPDQGRHYSTLNIHGHGFGADCWNYRSFVYGNLDISRWRGWQPWQR